MPGLHALFHLHFLVTVTTLSGMHITPITVHGRKRYRLDLRKIGKGQPTFSTKTMAEAALEELSVQRKTAGDVWLTLSPQERNDLISINSEVTSAGHTLREVWNGFQENKSHRAAPCTLANAITETIAAKKAANRREGYIDGLKAYLDAFAKGRETLQVSALGAAEIERWFAGRKEAPQTQNSNRGRLSAMFDLCWRRNYIRENPCHRISTISVESEAPAILTPAQCCTALRWTIKHRPAFLGWLVLSLLVGLRPKAEADIITWDDIDLSYKRIHIKAAKTKVRSHRIIDLTQIPNALPWLQLAKKHSPLPIRFGRRRRAIRRIRECLGLECWPQDILRHTAASYLFAHHQDAGKVAAILGNSASTLLRRYKALVVKEEAEKFYAITPPRLILASRSKRSRKAVRRSGRKYPGRK